MKTCRLILGDVDDGELLQEANVLVQLIHGIFQTFLEGFLRHGLDDEREALVLLVQSVPLLLQMLQKGNMEGIHNMPPDKHGE